MDHFAGLDVSDMAFQERRNRKRIRLPTPCGDGPRKPSGIRNSADKRSTSAPFRLHGIAAARRSYEPKRPPRRPSRQGIIRGRRPPIAGSSDRPSDDASAPR
jgi:hypothetical protein